MRAWPLTRVGEPTHPMRTSSSPMYTFVPILLQEEANGNWLAKSETSQRFSNKSAIVWNICVPASYINENSLINGFTFPIWTKSSYSENLCITK